MTLTNNYIGYVFKLTKVFVLLSFSIQASHAADVSHLASLRVAHNDNIGFTSNNGEAIESEFLELNFARNHRRQLSVSSSLFYSAELDVRQYSDYKLKKASLGFNIGYEKKLGLGFDKPRLSIAWDLSRDIYEHSSLSKSTSNLSLAFTRPLNEQIDSHIRLGVTNQFLNTQSRQLTGPSLNPVTPFFTKDLNSIELSLGAEYYATSEWSFPLNIQLVQGDLSSLSTPLSVKENVNDTWFIRNFIDAKAVSSSLAASRLLENNSTLNFELGYVSAESKQDIGYDRTQISITWSKSW